MKEDLLNSRIAKEVLTIIIFSDNKIQDKIPDNIIKNLITLSYDCDEEIHLNKNKKLSDQNLSEDALDIFSLIYYLYVSNEIEKQEIISNWVMNDKRYNEI